MEHQVLLLLVPYAGFGSLVKDITFKPIIRNRLFQPNPANESSRLIIKSYKCNILSRPNQVLCLRTRTAVTLSPGIYIKYILFLEGMLPQATPRQRRLVEWNPFEWNLLG